MALPEGVNDILPLSPAQTGMLFHVLEAPEAQGRYVAVLSCTIEGPLDPQRFRNAMQAAVQTRDSFRAGFVWKGTKQPVQVIREAIELPWAERDWRSDKSCDAAISRLIVSEQKRQFDLKKPPLMAVTLVRTGEERWQLIWTIHHLISDGWSTSVVLKDVFALYVEPEHRVPKSASFKDYVTWLKKSASQIDVDFWADHLNDIDGPCLLPRDETAATHQPHSYHARALGAGLLRDVDALARDLRITTHTILSAAWALTLRRLLQENDVIFGQTSAGRPVQIQGIATAVGAFINTLPIRVAFDPEISAEAFLLAHSKAQQNFTKHEFASLAAVQKQSPIPKGTALFDTVFVNEGVQQDSYDFGELRLTNLLTKQASNYAATILVTPNGDFCTELYADPAALNGKQAEQCLVEYETCLRALIADPKKRIRDLAWHETASVTLPKAKSYQTVLDRFLTHATTQPEALAITDGDLSITYRELSQRARQYAALLASKGVVEGDLVPVALPRGQDVVAAFLGVMMLGGAYVPIDTMYPNARILQILGVVEPKHIISTPKIADELALDREQLVLNTELAAALPLSEIRRGPLAYVIFTSGSQGKPKGVEITQDAFAISTWVRDEVYQGTPDAFLLLSSLAFDSSVVGLYWTLATGGHLIIAANQAEQQPRALGALIAQHHITHTLCLPSLAQALIAAIPCEDLQSLRMVIAAGEAMPASLVETCAQALPKCRLINEYGPTETTVWCTTFDATGYAKGANIPIGKAPPGTWVGVVGLDDRPVPAGQTGEIVIAGPMLARGYRNDPEQTDERFNSLGPDGPRVYRTGDLARIRDDGIITYLGRKDTQVKSRGFRVELSEIETATQALVGGREVVALLSDDKNSIHLVVEGAEEIALSLDIADHLATSLPAPFQPSLIQFQTVFPHLPNGKVDRKTLQAKLQHNLPKSVFEPPIDDLERSIAELYQELLNTDPLPRDAHFFDLGGDSLKTLAAYVKAQERGLNIQPSDIFNHPTVQKLAAFIRSDTGRIYDDQEDGIVQIVNANGRADPVFFVHGSIRLLNQVVLGLKKDTPVILQFKEPLLNSPAPFGKTIEQMAHDSLELLKKQNPKGPYVLCGFSVGCAIAMEMAKRLGPNAVKSLVLLDPPYDMIGTNPERQRLWTRTKKRWHIIARRWFRVRRFKPRIEKAKKQFALTPHDRQLRHANFDLAYVDALARYFIPLYFGKTEIFFTDINTSLESGDVMDTHFPNKTLTYVDVSHDGLIEDPEGISKVSKAIISNCSGS